MPAEHICPSDWQPERVATVIAVQYYELSSNPAQLQSNFNDAPNYITTWPNRHLLKADSAT